MLKKILKNRKEKVDIKKVLKKIIKEKNGSYTKIINLINFKNSKIYNDELIKDVLKENKAVKLYLNEEKTLNINDFLNIENNKYYLFLAKEYEIINLHKIERIHKIMPEKMKKMYVFKKINKESHNKNVRFKS